MGTETLTGKRPPASLAGVVASPDALPPLENGDRLTRSDFEQRYDAMPHVKKAELIEGIVYMPSPVERQWCQRDINGMLYQQHIFDLNEHWISPRMDVGQIDTERKRP